MSREHRFICMDLLPFNFRTNESCSCSSTPDSSGLCQLFYGRITKVTGWCSGHRVQSGGVSCPEKVWSLQYCCRASSPFHPWNRLLESLNHFKTNGRDPKRGRQSFEIQVHCIYRASFMLKKQSRVLNIKT